MKKNMTYFFLLLLVMLVSNACATGKITYLINEKTENFSGTKKFNMKNAELDDYKVNDVLFVPYMTQVFRKENDWIFSVYSLRLTTYKSRYNESSVIIDSVNIIGNDEVEIEPKMITIDKKVDFGEKSDDSSVFINNEILLDEINNDDLELNEKSVVQVILNIVVTKNGIDEYAELVYEFKPHTRKYLKQR